MVAPHGHCGVGTPELLWEHLRAIMGNSRAPQCHCETPHGHCGSTSEALMGHQRVIVKQLRAIVGHSRAIMGHSIAIIGHPRVIVRHPRVSLGLHHWPGTGTWAKLQCHRQGADFLAKAVLTRKERPSSQQRAIKLLPRVVEQPALLREHHDSGG